MLTKEQFNDLSVGDVIETSPLFAGLGTEPLILKVTGKGEGELTFVKTYFNINLGEAKATLKGEDVTWVM